MDSEATTNQSIALSGQRSGPIERLAQKAVLSHFAKIRRGYLEIQTPDGDCHAFGDESSALRGIVRVRDTQFFRRSLVGADIGFGESYMEGEWDSPDATAVLRVLAENMQHADERGFLANRIVRAGDRIRHFLNANTRLGSRKNIARHYDLSNDFFRVFLDETMTYSCALWRRPEETLREAQLGKIHALIAQARIGPNDHVLEIGSGWGALAIEAVHKTGCRVTTVTLSREQLAVVRERVNAAGLEDRITPMLCDYRDVQGQFDKVVSVEMLEAVGHEYLGTFFKTVDRLLAPNGIAAIQVITIPDQRYDRYRRSTDWLQKHIFPGAVVPSLTALTNAMTRDSSLMIERAENIGIHYARTLREWRQVFLANIDSIRGMGFDDRFCRMWDYYLRYCEAGFESRLLGTMHLMLTRPNNITLPVHGE